MTDTPNPVLVAVGWLLTVLGALWTLLAGGCTLVFAVEGILPALQHKSGADAASLLPVVAIFGAAGIIPGALILWGGLAILHGQRRAKR